MPTDDRALNKLDVRAKTPYPLLAMEKVRAPVITPARRAAARISSKHQITIPIAALRAAGLKPGDRLRASVGGPGQIILLREEDPVEDFAGTLTGVYPTGYLDDLRREWS